MYVTVKRITRPNAVGLFLIGVGLDMVEATHGINMDISQLSNSVVKTDLTIQKPYTERVIEYTLTDGAVFSYEVYDSKQINKLGILLGVF